MTVCSLPSNVPTTLRCGWLPSSATRFCSSVPPNATLRICMPRQIASTGMLALDRGRAPLRARTRRARDRWTRSRGRAARRTRRGRGRRRRSASARRSGRAARPAPGRRPAAAPRRRRRAGPAPRRCRPPDAHPGPERPAGALAHRADADHGPRRDAHAAVPIRATRSRNASNSPIARARFSASSARASGEHAVRVDALAIELVARPRDPVRHDLGRHLRVELDAEAPADRVRLRPGRAVVRAPSRRRAA